MTGRGTVNVLYVDPDATVGAAFVAAVAGDGLCVSAVPTAEAALGLLGECECAVVVVNLDAARSALALLTQARGLAPECRRLLVSDGSDAATVRDAVNRAGVDQILPRPSRAEELRATVRRAADMYLLMRENARLTVELARRSQRLEELNLYLDEQVRTRTTNLLDSLIGALDLRDTETQWHSRRVAIYALEIADAMDVPMADRDDIERGALLHDIGKIGLPDAILRKPGPLDAREWARMRTHPELGYRLLEGIDYLAEARRIVLHHHERWDGRGYPAGLPGPRIALGARIFQVADTLDAMASDRPYRAAPGFAAARAEIRRCSASQFDPAVVEAYDSISDDIWQRVGAPFSNTVRIPIGETARVAAWRRPATIGSDPSDDGLPLPALSPG
ncbi:MAG TPA: HD domain-containing phosphohydrolase [Polyangia bacterium]|jgi:putative nucleotidyltransferase with HDIG domain